MRISAKNIVLYFVLVVSVISIVVRFLYLDADPPLFFQNTSQALLTDPYNVTYAARNKALFDKWDTFDYHRWEAFKYSLSSFSAYIFFKLGGVSRITANLSATGLSLSAILLFIWAVYSYSRRASAFAAVLLLANAFIIIYGRYPFLENGLLFISVVLFVVFVKFYPRKWAIVAAAILTSLCVLSGKAFGVIMAVPVMTIIVFERRQKWLLDLGFYVVSGIISGIALLWLYYGSRYDIVYHYISEQSTGLYGFPQALSSVPVFFEQLVSFGGQSKFYYLSPFILFLFFITLVNLLLREGNLYDYLKKRRQFLFCLAWFFFGFLFLMVFNNRPLRYRMILMPALAGLIAFGMADLPKTVRDQKLNIPRIIGTLLLCWHVCTQVIFLFYSSKVTPAQHHAISWYTFIPGALFTALIYFLHRPTFKFINYKSLLPYALIILCVFYQGHWIYDWFSHRVYELKRANQDLEQIVAPNAIIMGPYSQALTIDNGLLSFVYMFGLTSVENDLFSGTPFTHVATDGANWDRATRIFPDLKNQESETRYWVREFSVDIYRCPETDKARPYYPTDYEKAVGFLYTNSPDSTLFYLNRFREKFPNNVSGLTLLSNYYLVTRQFSKGLSVMDEINELYPGEFTYCIESGFTYYKVYLLTGKPEMLSRAEELFRQAVKLNPLAAETVDDARHQADETMRKYKK